VSHGFGSGDLFVDQARFLRIAEFGGGRQNLAHEILGILMELGIFQYLLCVPSPGPAADAQSIKGDIPDQLVPSGGANGWGHCATHAGFAENLREGSCAGRVAAGEVGKLDVGARHIAGNAWFGSGDADVADSAQHPLLSGYGSKKVLVAEAVLEGADHGIGTKERG